MTDNQVSKVYYARVLGNFKESLGKEEIIIKK
jgi:hypothetical protein